MELTEPQKLALKVGVLLLLALVLVALAYFIFSTPAGPRPTPRPGAIITPYTARFSSELTGANVAVPFVRPSVVRISPEGLVVVVTRAENLVDRKPGPQGDTVSPNGIFAFELIDPSKRSIEGNLRLKRVWLPDCSLGDLTFNPARGEVYASCRDEEGAGFNRVYFYAWDPNKELLTEKPPRYHLQKRGPERMVLFGEKLYLASEDFQEVTILDPATHQRTGGITSPKPFRTRAVAFDTRGNLIVATAGQTTDIVQLFDPQGRYLRSLDDALFTPTITKPQVGGESITDFDIAVLRDGRILMSYSRQNAVLVFDAEYKLLRKLTGSPGEPFELPKSLAVDAQNRVYVTDSRRNSLKAFDADNDFAYLGRFP